MGTHLLLEVYDVDFKILNDVISLQESMENGIKRAKMTILNIFLFEVKVPKFALGLPSFKYVGVA